jgi:single-strand DNA-binding protein
MNTIQLIGRLTRDPELRYTPTGVEVTTLRLAVPRRKKDGEDQGAVYIDVVAFGKQAQAVTNYLSKGRRVAVTGRLEYREWKDRNDGSPHSVHEVVADQVGFLDAAPQSDNGGSEPAYAAGKEPF